MSEQDVPPRSSPGYPELRALGRLAVVVAVVAAVIWLSPNVDVGCNGVHMLAETQYACFYTEQDGYGVYLAWD